MSQPFPFSGPHHRIYFDIYFDFANGLYRSHSGLLP
jgi:hypothetical protein